MKPIIYNMTVGTADQKLVKNSVSRAYALLNTKVKNGKVFGFQYRFFSQYKSQVEEEFSRAERPIDQPSKDLSGLIQAEDNTISRTHILNGSDLAESAVTKQYTILNNMKTGSSGVDNDTELLSLFKVSVSGTDTVGEHLKVFGNASNLESIAYVEPVCIQATHSISGVSEIFHTMVEAINKESEAISQHGLKLMDELDKPQGCMLDFILMNKGNDNNSFIQKGHKLMVNSPNLSRITGNNIKFAIDRAELSTLLLDQPKFGYWYDDEGVFFKELIRVNADSNIDANFFDKLIAVENANADNIAQIDALIKYASRQYINSMIPRVTFGMDRIQKHAEDFADLIAYDRSGKDNSIVVEKTTFANRYGKDSLINTYSHIFSDRQMKPSSVVVSHILFNKQQRPGRINEDHKDTYNRGEQMLRPGRVVEDVGMVDRIRRAAEIFPDTVIIGSHRINDEVYWMNPYILAAQTFRPMMRVHKVQYAVNPNRPVFRLFNVFEARAVTKVIFSDRANKPFMMLRSFEPAERPGKECILIVDMRVALNKEAIAEIKEEIKFALSNEAESVIMIGLVESDNRESECDILVTEIADSKNSVDASVDLLSVGWSKAEHLTEFTNVIDADSDRFGEAVKAVLSLAIDINKKRMALKEGIQDIGESFRQHNTPAMHSGYLVPLAKVRTSLQGDKLSGIIDADWDTEWNQLTRIYIDSKDRDDRIKVPNDDYNYEKITKNLYDPVTGIPKDPIGPTNKPEVQVKFPNAHYNPKYKDLYREIIPVDLYCYKDMMLLIWIFWCKHRSSEKVLETLKEFYQTENIEMTMIQEYAKIVQFDASRAINYVLDNINQWIQRTIAYFDKNRMKQYERIMKQVRWFGEKIAHDMSKYILVREYGPFYLDNSTWEVKNHVLPIDGEVTVEVFVAIGDKVSLYINDEVKLEITEPGVYRISNLTNSEYIKPAPSIPLEAGTYDIKLIKSGTGTSIIYKCIVSNSVFKGATIRYEGEPGRGGQAIDKLLQMMYDYYEIHHKNKAKGPREFWMWS